jgi:Phosphotransferase enzyme family
MHPNVLAWTASVLPAPVTELADRSWPDGKSSVHQVRDGDGSSWFIKHHGDREWYSTEVAAYRRWVPLLGNRAPVLHAHNDSLCTIIVSALHASGPQSWRDDDVRRDAGVALRTLHGAESFGPWEDIAGAKQAELERWSGRGVGLLSDAELEIAKRSVTTLAELPAPERVPCHGDYTPRNWIIDNRRVRVIDFEETQPDAWMSDIGRMTIGFWPGQSHLTDAVLDGYGRRLSADDEATAICLFAVTAVKFIVLGIELGKRDFVSRTQHVLQQLDPHRATGVY